MINNQLNIKQLQIKENNKILIHLNNILIKKSAALIGESGSGKSLTLKSILRLLPSNLQLLLDCKCTFKLNNNNIGFIPQNPFTSLSPLTKIKNQFFCEKQKIIELLGLVNLDEDTLKKYPAHLSGGQLQRIVIAIVLSKKPKLLLLDEPTTSLDKDTKNMIIELIINLQKKLNFLILFVTHDISTIKNLCDDIVVIKNGSIIEQGKTVEILNNPSQAYTKSLISSNFYNRSFRQ